jgi:hypothetical protein
MMPVPKSIAPLSPWIAQVNSRAGLRQDISLYLQTGIPTTGSGSIYTIAPEDGYLHSVDFSGLTALAANDTNYITFFILNYGQDGAATKDMLAITAENSTKVTGGLGLAAHTRRSLKIHPTIANLKVLAGDRLLVGANVTGTLGVGIAGVTFLLRFNVQ